MKIILYSSFDCLVKVDDLQETINQNQHLQLDTLPKNIYVYPIGKGLRVAFNVDLSNKNSPFYRIIEKDDKVLVFFLDGILSQNAKVFNFSYDNNNCQIEVSKRSVRFSCKDKAKTLSLPDNILNSQCGNFYHIAYAKLDTDESQYFIAHNIKNNHSRVFKGQEITLSDDGFSILSFPHGYEKAEESFAITPNGLKKQSQNFIPTPTPTTEQTLAYKFMSSIKIGDYQTAHLMLSPSLAKTITPIALKEYFGNISYLFPLTKTTCFAISNNQSKLYSFTFLTNQITDISD